MSSFELIQSILLEEINRYEKQYQSYILLEEKKHLLKEVLDGMLTRDYFLDLNQRTLMKLQIEMLFPEKKETIFSILDRERWNQEEKSDRRVTISKDKNWKLYRRLQFFQNNLDARKEYQETKRVEGTEEYRNLLSQLQEIYWELDRKGKALAKTQSHKDYYLALQKLEETLGQNGHLSKKEVEMILHHPSFRSMSARKQSVLLEAIVIRNQELLSSSKTIETPMLSQLNLWSRQELEKVDLPEKEKEKMDALVPSYLQLLLESEEDQPEDFHEDVFSFLPNNKTQAHVALRVLHSIQDRIVSLQEFLEVPEVVLDDEMRMELKKEFENNRKTYQNLYRYYESISTKDQEVLKEETVTDSSPVKQIFFVSTPRNQERNRCYLLEDLKKFPEEYFSTVQQLLTSYQNGTLSPVKDKCLTDKDGLREMKDDQVRIIYRSTSKNVTWILGALVKKEDNDRRAYESISERERWIPHLEEELIKEENLEKAEETRQLVEEFLETKQRRGTR